MSHVYAFSEAKVPSLADVGGKGLSLILMFHAGLRVPTGFVLGVDFFDPWLAALKRSRHWSDFVAANDGELADACNRLKAQTHNLSLDAEQRASLQLALQAFEPGTLFAVRSSSPEEDLEGSSFAGGYETVLGVAVDQLGAAIVKAFASCLDVRVAVYKKAHGFDPHDPRIAVVVQKQVASDVAGVGFSINPISNDLDEAVLNANWGLGETVVSGIATPDLFVVDKSQRRILSQTTGRKETAIWLEPDGGTQQRAVANSDALSLSDDQVLAIVDQLLRIEGLYGKPMDIEWAFENGELYLLQARPITTQLMLPDDVMTAPGRRRTLLLDLTSSVQGILEPMSVMGTSLLARLFSHGSIELVGQDVTQELAATIPYCTTGRLYANLSNVLAVTTPSKLAEFLVLMDPLAAGALKEVDHEAYRAEGFAMAGLVVRAINHVPPRLLNLIEGRLMPEHARDGCNRVLSQFEREANSLAEEDLSLGEFADRLLGRIAQLILRELLPRILMARRAVAEIWKLFPSPDEETAWQLGRIDRSLPGNVTVEMGLALAEVAELLSERGLTYRDVAALKTALDTGAAPTPFVHAWQTYLDRYGHRGPKELDVASPRFRDQHNMLLEQVLQMASRPEGSESPRAVHERNQHDRRLAYDKLREVVHETHGWRQTKRFESHYRVLESLFGFRETPKFYVVYCLDLIRSRLMTQARALVAERRLDRVEQVFDLTLDDLDRAKNEPGLDLRNIAKARRAPVDRLAAAPELPRLFDSRGRIFRPPAREAREGELRGQPISQGVVRGIVNVLHSPDEKPLMPGQILVARATDPGWTPLFVNAAAIVLEVGGLLQHGALVAREYGKPCVAGVERATELLRDGALVEVDGAAGIVRLL